ncbi:hypothetical protein BDV09DRAFT_199728 [Aspergillus tetrazonus]
MDELLYDIPPDYSLAPLADLPDLYSPTFSGRKSPTLQELMGLELNADPTSFSETSPQSWTVNPRVLTLREECYSTQGCDVAIDPAIARSNSPSPSDCPQLDNPNSPGLVEESSSCSASSDDNAENSDSDCILFILSEQEFLKGELKTLKKENMRLRRLLKENSKDGRTSKVASGGKAERRVKASRVRKSTKGEIPAPSRRSGRKRAVVDYRHWQWLPDDEVITID